MKALVTGGAGFVGSHLADRLLREGYEVHVLDDLSTGSRNNLNPDARFAEGSVLDKEAVYHGVTEVDVVFHLAAAVGVKLVVEDPVGTLMTNLRGTELVLASCSELGKRVVLASTSEVYGREGNDGDQLREDDQRLYGPTTARRWAYAESKAIDEFLALAYRDEHGLDIRIARLFNTVGPRQSGAYGMVLPRFAEAAVRGEPIEVFGTGKQTRCFCHVSDVVDGLVRLMLAPEPAHAVYNLGNPHNHVGITQLAELVKTLAESRSDIVYLPYEEAYGVGIEDMMHRKPEIGRAFNDLRWHPSTALKDIVAEAVAEAKSNLGHEGTGL